MQPGQTTTRENIALFFEQGRWPETWQGRIGKMLEPVFRCPFNELQKIAGVVCSFQLVMQNQCLVFAADMVEFEFDQIDMWALRVFKEPPHQSMRCFGTIQWRAAFNLLIDGEPHDIGDGLIHTPAGEGIVADIGNTIWRQMFAYQCQHAIFYVVGYPGQHAVRDDVVIFSSAEIDLQNIGAIKRNVRETALFNLGAAAFNLRRRDIDADKRRSGKRGGK